MDRYCIVDVSGIFRTNYHHAQKRGVNTAYGRTLDEIEYSTKGFNPNNVAICCDTRAVTFRHQLTDGAYKAHREEAPLQMYELLRETEDELAKSHHVFRCDGFEADDICATLANFLTDLGDENGHRGAVQVTVASTDKDLAQVVNDMVSWFRIGPNKTLDPSGVRDMFGVDPWQVPHSQALMGDSSDGYSGVDKVGKKMAPQIISLCGDVDGVINMVQHEATSLRAIPGLGPSIMTSLLAAIDSGDLRLGLKLATLRRDVPIDCGRLLGDVGTGAPTSQVIETKVMPAGVSRDPTDEIAALFNL